MNDSEKYIQNVIAFHSKPSSVPNNTPSQYADRQRQYLASRNADFINRRAYLAADYVEAEVQGIQENFYEWVKTTIRLADALSISTNINRGVDDYKEILFDQKGIDYFPIGAKVRTMGNTWLCINPSNMSAPNANGLVVRCNASYNSYDYYGNIVTEELVVERYDMVGNDNESQNNLELLDGNFRVTCQLNSNTELLGMNKRIILGRYAYHITGFTDFIQEFTGNYDSVHIMSFTARIEEPTDKDDMVNRIAEGKTYSFSGFIANSPESLTVGKSVQLQAHFLKNQEETAATQEYPISWVWESSDESVATVDSNGNVTAIAEGKTTITATLVQNTDISASVTLNVSDQTIEPYILFKGNIPESIEQYESADFSAVYVEDGEETDEPVEWSFDGAEADNYAVETDENSASVECISPADEPLVITASCNGVSASVEVWLKGY